MDETPYKIVGYPRGESDDVLFGCDNIHVENAMTAVDNALEELIEAMPKSMLPQLPAAQLKELHDQVQQIAFRPVPAEELDIKYTNMKDMIQKAVVGTAYEGCKKFEGNAECSRFVKNQLESLMGGPWVVLVGDDFGCLLTGREFNPQTLLHFSITNRGFLVYQPKLS